jgi:mono/diheme cytochrome c family protein
MAIMAEENTESEWQAPSHAERRKNPIVADSKSIAAGKAVYSAQCAQCHGTTGKGDGCSAKDLSPSPADLSDPALARQTDGALFWKITTGRRPMPASENIAENDRWNLINYIRTLSPASSTQPTASR